MPDDNRYLQRRWAGWYATVKVPPSLQGVMGKQRLLRSLGTRDLSEARRLRHGAVADLKASIEKVRQGFGAGHGGGLDGEALERWRRFERERDDEKALALFEAMAVRSIDIEGRQGKVAMQDFVGVATGQSTPIIAYLEDRLAESTYEDKQKSDHRYAVRLLEAWLRREGMAAAVETVNDKVAGRFKAEAIMKAPSRRTGKPVSAKTANKYLSFLRTYWKWLLDNGHADYLDGRNPWAGKSLPKRGAFEDEKQRPFADDEVVKLFAGGPDQETRDVMLLGALSGMRLEEIFRLTVADCAGGAFKVRRAKTAAGVRLVPIHPDLVALVNRRCEGKAASHYVIHEAAPTGWDGTRSAAFSKRFNQTYRQRCGVHDRPGGRQKSRVNYHSFRAWFMRKAEEARQPLNLIKRTVGQEADALQSIYVPSVAVETLGPVVASVRLRAKLLELAASDDLAAARHARPARRRRRQRGRAVSRPEGAPGLR